jgi:HEAT repeat protein
VVVFGLLHVGFYLYEPMWFKIQEYRLLSDDPATVKDAEISIAGKGTRSSEKIRKWLKSPIERLNDCALNILDNMPGADADEFLPELEIFLSEVSSDRAQKAADLVYNHSSFLYKVINEEGIPISPIEKHLTSKNAKTAMLIFKLAPDSWEYVRIHIADKLGEIGDKRAVEPLIYALLNDDENVSISAAKSLGALGDARAVDALIKTLEKHWSYQLRGYIAVALARIGGPRVYEPLIRALEKDEDWFVRIFAVNALGALNDNRAVIPLIHTFENDSYPLVRIWAAGALGRFKDRRAVEPLLNVLENDGDPDVRKTAALALAEFGDNHATEILLNILETDNNSHLRVSAAERLSEIKDNRITGALVKAVENDCESMVRREVFDILLKLDNAAAYECLLNIINDNSENMSRTYFTKLMIEMADNRAVLPLIKVLENSPEPGARYFSVIALAGIGDERAIEPLEKTRTSDSDWRVNNIASVALNWIQSSDYPMNSNCDRAYFSNLYSLTQAKCGKIDALENVIKDFPEFNNRIKRFYSDVLSRMPDGFPEFDVNADKDIREKQSAAMQDWYKKNNSRIAWDAEKRKYYLKTEDSENK